MKLNDILRLSDEERSRTKIKLNKYNGVDNPVEVFKDSPEKINTGWLFWKSEKRTFEVGQIAVCLAQIKDDFWLLTTVKKVEKDLGITGEGVNYEGSEYTEYKDYYGRLIIRYHNSGRNMCMFFNTVADELEVVQLLPDVLDDEFPGYDKVCLSYRALSRIVRGGNRGWHAALENQKAVYLITDTRNGKMYVGSATAENGMLLKRWTEYAENGHGGNKQLMELVAEKGFDYVKENFQYTILENYNARVDDGYILSRESWWKKVLKTREFGYNGN